MHVLTNMDEMLKYASTFVVKDADVVQGQASIHALFKLCHNLCRHDGGRTVLVLQTQSSGQKVSAPRRTRTPTPPPPPPTYKHA